MSNTNSTGQPATRDELRLHMRTILDARALNLRQARLIRNTSPQVDSIVEVVQEMIKDGPSAKWVLELSRLVKQIEADNHLEGLQECVLAGGIERSLQRHFAAKRQMEPSA